MPQGSADNHLSAWEEMPPLRAAEGEGDQKHSLDRRQVTLTLCPVRRYHKEDKTFFFSLLGLDIDAT